MGALAIFGMFWALTVPLTKVAVSSGHPVIGLIFWQLLIGAVVTRMFLWLRKRSLRFDRDCRDQALPGDRAAWHHPAQQLLLPRGRAASCRDHGHRTIATVPMFALLVSLAPVRRASVDSSDSRRCIARCATWRSPSWSGRKPACPSQRSRCLFWWRWWRRFATDWRATTSPCGRPADTGSDVDDLRCLDTSVPSSPPCWPGSETPGYHLPGPWSAPGAGAGGIRAHPCVRIQRLHLAGRA